MPNANRLVRIPTAKTAWLLIQCVVLASFLFCGPRPARADDWMFRRSYFSHAPDPAVDYAEPPFAPRSAYRRAYIGTGPGFAVRGGYRYNYIYLRSGNSVDITVLREGWFEATPP